MKRLFRIGAGLFIYSIIPILSWIVLSKILHDERIANVFSITYAIQFIWAILKYLFGSGANIKKEKANDQNAVWNGILWGTIFSIVIFAIPLIFVDNYITFFGQDVEFYRIYVIYGIALIFLQTLFSFIIEKLYFEDKEKLANVHLFSFNFTAFCVLIFSNLIIPQRLIALLITLGILAIYIICLYIWQFEKFTIDFTFLKNFKYESAGIVSSIFMLIIYLFGFKIAFATGQEYLVALNIIGLCTDTQWDMLGAISTTTKVDIAKGRFEYIRHIKNSYIYTTIVTLTSIIMSLILCWINDVVFYIAMIYLIFQIVDMFLHPYTTILAIYTQIEYSPTLTTIIFFTLKLLRTILSIFIISPYCTDIGQIVQGSVGFMCFLLIRIIKYRVVDGKLNIKTAKKQIKSTT